MVNHNPSVLNIGQVNLQRARAASHGAHLFCLQNHVSLLCIQEPYAFVSPHGDPTVLPFWGLATKVLHARSSSPITAAIVSFLSPADHLLLLTHLCTPYLTACEIEVNARLHLLISIYISPQADFREALRVLGRCLDFAGDRPVIIVGDFNAKSHTWHSTYTDGRGALLDNFAVQNGLYFANLPNQPETFWNTNGASNIDLTLFSAGIANRIHDWHVHVDAVLSDHRMITFSIDKEGPPSQVTNYRDPFRVKPRRLTAEYERAIRDSPLPEIRPENSNSIDQTVEALTERITSAFLAAAPVKQTRSTGSTWWTDELATKRARVSALRRRFQDSRSEIDKRAFARVRAEYKADILKAKMDDWTRFVRVSLQHSPWSLPYKLAAKKTKRPLLCATVLRDDGHTISVEETLETILDTLMPLDSEETDSPQQADIRRHLPNCTGDVAVTAVISREEVSEALSRLGRRKAPGPDNIHGITIKSLLPILEDTLYNIYSACFNAGHFPIMWKRGRLVTFLKNSDSDPTKVKSLRPITLLCELGKVLEKLMLLRLEEIPTHDLYGTQQFGFVRERGTVQACQNLISQVDNTYAHHLLVFLDISGAFNNLWWPALLETLHHLQIPHNLFSLFRSYFLDRAIEYSSSGVTLSRILSKGCPQGSVLGPALWNVNLAVLLSKDLPEGCGMTAYADDLALVVNANNRAQLEQRSAQALGVIHEWASARKLEISREKSQYLVLGDTLKCNPRIKIGGRNITRARRARYLGVIMDPRLSFVDHVGAVVARARRTFGSVRRLTATMWGQLHQPLREIYHRAILPQVEYAIAVWAHRLQHSHVRRKLAAIQGLCLRTVLSVYATVPTDSVCILAREPPLFLLLDERQAFACLKRRGTCLYLGRQYRLEDFAGRAEAYRAMKEATLDRWQELWTDSEKGRSLYLIIPEIRAWLDVEVRLDRHTAQFLTGHFECALHLHRIGKADSPNCDTCHVIDDQTHRILACRKYERARNAGRAALSGFWPSRPEEIVDLISRSITAIRPFMSDPT